MRILREKPFKFTPIIIKIESQAELANLIEDLTILENMSTWTVTDELFEGLKNEIIS